MKLIRCIFPRHPVLGVLLVLTLLIQVVVVYAATRGFVIHGDIQFDHVNTTLNKCVWIRQSDTCQSNINSTKWCTQRSNWYYQKLFSPYHPEAVEGSKCKASEINGYDPNGGLVTGAWYVAQPN